jgi:hypothetical protein
MVKTPNAKQHSAFMAEWYQYVSHLEDESVSCNVSSHPQRDSRSHSRYLNLTNADNDKCCLPVQDLFGLGRDLSDADLESLSADQRQQLQRLQQSTAELQKNTPNEASTQ